MSVVNGMGNEACEVCGNFTWDRASMQPVTDAGGHVHHPSCSTLPGGLHRAWANPWPLNDWAVVRSTLGPRGASR